MVCLYDLPENTPSTKGPERATVIGLTLKPPRIQPSITDNFNIPLNVFTMTEQKKSFEEQNDEANDGGFINEFRLLLKENKKWWITPIIVCLLFFGALIILGGSSAAPFIYTLF